MTHPLRKLFCIFSALFLYAGICIAGDNDLTAIGQWRVHLPFNKAVSTAEGNGKVYCASRYGLFSFNKSDNSIERYTKVSGLSDLEIASIRYSAGDHVLVIAYENSNIDLLYDDNTIVNISDLTRSNIVGNKSINDIYFKDHMAYLSCGFGIIQLNLLRQEIKDTYYIGPNGSTLNVNGFTSDGSYFYAATGNGIYKAPVNSPNLFNYQAWSKDTTVFDPSGVFGSIACFANKIFAVNTDFSGNRDTLLFYDGNSWSGFYYPTDYDTKVFAYLDHLMIKVSFTIAGFDASLQRTHLMNSFAYPNLAPKDGFISADNTFWVADNNNGLIRISPGDEYTAITPNGPRSSSVYAMECRDSRLWVASGTVNATTATYSRDGCYLFADESWKTFDAVTDPVYASALVDTFPDLSCIAVDPTDSKHAFAGTWGSGLLEYGVNGVTAVYNQHNSTLKSISSSIPGFDPVQIGGVAFDSDNNLWMTNTLNSTPLSVRKTDGTWQSFVVPAIFANTFVYNILVDDFNQKWMVSRGTGVGVFYENDINNPNDDSWQLLTSSVGYGGLPSLTIFSMAKDKDGAIWFGSDQGVFVIYNPGNVFSGSNYDAQKILLQQDTHTQYLLETETVLAVAVDGANRKWFGTVGGGVFLMSADGTQQLLHFDVDNSPLLSNYVNSIAIDDQTGEVFFGTEKGIISYRGDATEGTVSCGDHLVFPNPVKHGYSGPIAIKGLVNNADVKITDISGALVYHAKANGGEAIWNGKNFSGDRAHTGVYLVYATNDDGSATCVTKMMFIH